MNKEKYIKKKEVLPNILRKKRHFKEAPQRIQEVYITTTKVFVLLLFTKLN